MTSGRKTPSVPRLSGLDSSGQQQLQEIPAHTPRHSLTSATSPTAHNVGSKSRSSDIKYRKSSKPFCSRLSPHSRSRANKPEKELEGHRTPDCKQRHKVVNKEGKGEIQKTDRTERKRQKKRDEKRLGERKKKMDKTVKNKEQELGSKITESGDDKLGKKEPPVRLHRSQSLSKRKHREKPEQAEKVGRPPGNAPHSSCVLLHPSSKYENPRKLPVTDQLVQSKPKKCRPSQASRKAAIVSSRSEDGPKGKGDDSLPSLLFKALAPLSTACSVSLEQPVQGKDGRQGGVLSAPDLQPVNAMGSFMEMEDNLANTPPVLSWQGSPVSDLGEDEEDLKKGVICRPVLQPSPTQCSSPPLPPIQSENIDDINKEDCESIPAEKSLDNTSELPCATEDVSEEEEVDGSGSLFHELCHRKTELDDVFQSLATFLGGHRAPCRGGPFGGSAANVKCSSSLSFAPQHQDFSESDAIASSSPCNVPHTISDTHPTNLSEPLMDALVQEKQEETENGLERKQEHETAELVPESIGSTLLDRSLRAELTLTTTNPASLSRLLTVSSKDESKHSRQTECIHADRKIKQNVKNGERKGETKIKPENSSRLCEKGDLEGTDVLSLIPVISRTTANACEEVAKRQTSHKDQTQLIIDNQEEKMEVKTVREKREVCELTEAPHSAVSVASSDLCVSTPSSKPPYTLAPVDPLKLKALSMGLCKELKIVLIKVDNRGRQTFNISELEEQRIPLPKMNIENTATEVIRACK